MNNGGDWNIVSYSVNGTGDTQKPYSMSQKACVMIPDESTVQKAEAMMKKVRDGETVSQEEADSATSAAAATDNDAQAATGEVQQKHRVRLQMPHRMAQQMPRQQTELLSSSKIKLLNFSIRTAGEA